MQKVKTSSMNALLDLRALCLRSSGRLENGGGDEGIGYEYQVDEFHWKMREGIQVGKGVNEETDYSSIIEHFVRESSSFSPCIIELKEL